MMKKQRIIELANSQPWQSNACLAREAGVTREYVRQVFEEEGSPHWRRRHGKILRWACPECGTGVEVIPSQLAVHMPAHCRPCAKKYCRRGHIRTIGTECYVCSRIRENIVVGYRNCIDCKKKVSITKQQHRIGIKRKRCAPCQGKRASAIRAGKRD